MESASEPEPPSTPLPEPEDIKDQAEPATELDHFHPQWWERIRALAGSRPSESAQPEVPSEASAAETIDLSDVDVKPEVEFTPGERLSSDDMFAALGAQLRTRRLALNLTREEIERHIRVRAHYLKALEDGDFGGLPSAVQTRGMLTNYATFLDLNVDALLLRFADVLQVRHRERHPLPPGARGRVQPSARATLPPLRGIVAADLLGIGLLVLLVAFTVWGVNRVMETRLEVEAEPTPISISDVLLASTEMSTQVMSPTPGFLDLENLTATPLAPEDVTALPTFPEGVTVQLNIVALERTYMRVLVDGEVAFDGRVTPGTAYPFDARDSIEILTGNGAALRITYNLRDMGLLGNFGQVVNVIYTAGGIIAPTATNVPTATITLTPTITPSPTKTLVPSRTPTPQ